MAIIIGIDPGSRMTGYGVIKQTGDKLQFLDAGTIRTQVNTSDHSMPERLKLIFAGIKRITDFYQPTHAAVEQVFMATNPDSALKLGQARGAAIAALTFAELPVSEYTARQIKQSVVGYGAASKEQVQDMVCHILNLQITPQSDAADGLACAICHAHSNHSLNKLLAGANMRGRGVSRKKGRWRLSESDVLGKKTR